MRNNEFEIYYYIEPFSPDYLSNQLKKAKRFSQMWDRIKIAFSIDYHPKACREQRVVRLHGTVLRIEKFPILFGKL